jgi:hypothetical protein
LIPKNLSKSGWSATCTFSISGFGTNNTNNKTMTTNTLNKDIGIQKKKKTSFGLEVSVI